MSTNQDSVGVSAVDRLTRQRERQITSHKPNPFRLPATKRNPATPHLFYMGGSWYCNFHTHVVNTYTGQTVWKAGNAQTDEIKAIAQGQGERYATRAAAEAGHEPGH